MSDELPPTLIPSWTLVAFTSGSEISGKESSSPQHPLPLKKTFLGSNSSPSCCKTHWMFPA